MSIEGMSQRITQIGKEKSTGEDELVLTFTTPTDRYSFVLSKLVAYFTRSLINVFFHAVLPFLITLLNFNYSKQLGL